MTFAVNKMPQKGTFQYLKRKKNFELIKTCSFYGISFLIFIMGIFSTGSKNNLLTVVAVLGILPASRSLVSYIMYFRAIGCPKELYDHLQTFELNISFLYDLYFTSYKVNYPVLVGCIIKDDFYCLMEDQKKDSKKLKEHLEQQLKIAGIKGCSIIIFQDRNKFLQRIQALEEMNHISNTKSSKEIQQILFQISL